MIGGYLIYYFTTYDMHDVLVVSFLFYLFSFLCSITTCSQIPSSATHDMVFWHISFKPIGQGKLSHILRIYSYTANAYVTVV